MQRIPVLYAFYKTCGATYFQSRKYRGNRLISQVSRDFQQMQYRAARIFGYIQELRRAWRALP